MYEKIQSTIEEVKAHLGEVKSILEDLKLLMAKEREYIVTEIKDDHVVIRSNKEEIQAPSIYRHLLSMTV